MASTCLLEKRCLKQQWMLCVREIGQVYFRMGIRVVLQRASLACELSSRDTFHIYKKYMSPILIKTHIPFIFILWIEK